MFEEEEGREDGSGTGTNEKTPSGIPGGRGLHFRESRRRTTPIYQVTFGGRSSGIVGGTEGICQREKQSRGPGRERLKRSRLKKKGKDSRRPERGKESN